MRFAVRSDWVSSLSMEAVVVDLHASMAVSLSSTFSRAASTPSNFFVIASMDVVIWASNFVGLRGARSVERAVRRKISGWNRWLVGETMALDTNCNVPGYLEKEIRREKARNGKNRVEERDGEWSSEEMFLDSVIRRPHGSTLTGIYTAPVTGRPGGPSVRRPTARYNLCVATAHGQIQLTRPE